MDRATVLKYGSLAAFCCQNSLAPIVFRLAMTETTEAKRASTPAVLFVVEVGKCILSLILLWNENEFKAGALMQVVYKDAIVNKSRSLKLSVPAIVYAVQNALLQLSSGHLPGAVWHVTYQGKILATALMSMIILGKPLKRCQWFALLLMGCGISLVELSKSTEKSLDDMANKSEQNFKLGLVMVVGACFCSAFAGVFTEEMFKNVGEKAERTISLWLQNLVLSVWSMLITLATFLAQQSSWGEVSLLGGFTANTWALVALNAVGGMLVAMAIKYADNILRGFASAFATINGALLSIVALGFEMGASFVLGMLIVLASALLYGGVVKLPGEWWNVELRFAKPDIEADVELTSVDKLGKDTV
eukprot:TRINITY_DN14500_c0_g1_i3.p1 TRINITY_DN14500_c0_g1~~TRINITY_DN14500_c0_g1_i3.p1  ORF type:complete len:376 (-),score=73.82 TRINITY_DN14500_c0_g1_i3:17-1099(-)